MQVGKPYKCRIGQALAVLCGKERSTTVDSEMFRPLYGLRGVPHRTKAIFPWIGVDSRSGMSEGRTKLQAPQNNPGNTEFLTVAADVIHY